ncbi:MAG: TonB family protein [Fibrobacterota bacterium]
MNREDAGIRAGVNLEYVNNNGGETLGGYDPEEEEEPGRLLTDEEYSRMIRERETDIFSLDKNRILRNVEMVTLMMAVGAGAFFSTRQVIEVASDFYEKIPEEHSIVEVKQVEAKINRKKPRKKIEQRPESDRKVLRRSQNRGSNTSSKGGGDPRQRITKSGVLGIITGQMKGKTVASADIFAKGGFASDIDAIISGVGGLKKEGSGGVGRPGAAGIGFGTGFQSGFASGEGSIDDLLSGLMPGDGPALEMKVPKRPVRELMNDFKTGGALVGGRSRQSIMRVVMQNINSLRYAYNRRLREKPTLGGKATVKFAIDEFGNVIYAQVVESSLNDSQLEGTILRRVRNWVFEKIDKPGDVTEVVYPFVFSQ